MSEKSKSWVEFNFPWQRKDLTDDLKEQSRQVHEQMLLDKEEGNDDGLFDDKNFFSALGARTERDRSVLTILNKLYERFDDRAKRFKEYRLVSKDSIVGQAIEMMGDDATQFDIERERTVWIEAKDKNFENRINQLLQLYFEPFVDSIAVSILSFGEFAFKVIDNSGKTETDPDKDFKFVLLPLRKIERLHHLILNDYSHWFVVTDDIKKQSKDMKVLDNFAYIHFINTSIQNSTEIDLKLKRPSSEGGDGEPSIEEVFVLNGESILTEKVVEDFRILRTLENAIIATRLDKSKMIRFINVEVSKMDNQKAANLVNYIDSLINKNETISKNSDIYYASRIQAQPVNVVMPIKQDKGKVTIEESASTVDIKDIVDIDYFRNRLFAGLRTPKSYLGFEESIPGPNSAASLMRTDIRYARTVKKVQRILVAGVEEIVKVYCHYEGDKEIPEHKVRVIHTSSAEDEERYMELDARINLSQTFIEQILNPETRLPDKGKIELLEMFYTEVVPINSMVQFLGKVKKGIKIKSVPEGLGTKEGKSNPIGGKGGSSYKIAPPNKNM